MVDVPRQRAAGDEAEAPQLRKELEWQSCPEAERQCRDGRNHELRRDQPVDELNRTQLLHNTPYAERDNNAKLTNVTAATPDAADCQAGAHERLYNGLQSCRAWITPT